MPAGFYSKTDGGVFQIDGTYRNLFLRYKTTLTTTSAFGGGMFTGSLTSVANYGSVANAVIAVRCSYGATVYYNSPSTHDFQIAVQGPIGTTVDVYVFGEPAAAGASYGLQVWNDSGQLVFDALQKPMRVVGQLVTPTLGSTISTPSGRTCACVIHGGFYADVQNAGPGTWAYYVLRFGARISGTTVTMVGVCLQYTVTSSPGTETSPNNSCLLAVDVTDY